MTDHTPGPWTVDDDGYGEDCQPEEPGKRWLSVRAYDGEVEVAVLVQRKGEPTAQQYADARLIAAAPDLLAALEVMVGSWSVDHPSVEQADAAIAKARGA